ncbi:uncharacterized protein BDZ99DRAFT_419591 [Mytilinidion resinicola]|uniref:Large ribosomal subunit protein uL23m n=1 Tax=Mytilinidion resinicola TaxID=574789 RepID=A0A6A6YIR7_9PEZI|nr:uncharacterized protein BDZ99DRAFT_419591 [Mytilinidion resinicola]KAF2808459.1 hypothetical protein BDZ99DRAFT_419591 [Mytilinidion resinicola]
MVRFGRKEVYLPNAVIALIKSEHLPATHAKFRVPLTFSKLDLRDYLFHAYGLRTDKIRSYVQQQRVQHDRPDATVPQQNKWFRPKAIKHMTVEMDKPFVWPEDPESWEPWSKEIYSQLQDDADGRDKPATKIKEAREEAQTLAKQARELLQGKKRWRPTPVDEVVEEVDRDVKI